MSTLDQFRQQTREWLEANCPDSQRQPIVKDEQIWGGRKRSFASEDAQLWFERMRDKGWTAPDWPTEYGGGGLDHEQAQILQEEMHALNCRPALYDIGLWMFGPALLKFGTDAQKAEHIPKIIRGEIRWSQGYSEPAAGSDLAGLKTRAEDKGDHFLVNGTKIWTTQADKADWIFCLVRTDINAPKQEGISFLLIDMATTGVSTTPIKLISGDTEFCQTFFDDVVVPKDNLVGEFNQGWTVAKELLKHERKLMSIMSAMAEKEEANLPELAKRYVGVDDQGKVREPILRDRITSHLMNTDADALTNKRLFQQLEQGRPDPNLALIMKYVSTTELQRKDELLLAILGNRGLSWHDEEFTHQEKRTVQNWAYNKSHTIAGGTSEIQLNIIAKRVLQLPG
jgi:acyl-CoA dehydrogenase